MKMVQKLVAVCLALLPLSEVVGASTWLAPSENGSGVTMRVTPWLTNMPQTGYVPVSIKVENLGDSAGTWTLQSMFSDYRVGQTKSVFTFSGPAGGESRVQGLFAAKVTSAKYDNSYNRLSFNASGTGLQGGYVEALEAADSGNLASNSYVGLSSEGAKIWPWLKTSFETAASRSSSSGILGSVVDARSTPDDWRGLTSLTSYWITTSEHDTLSNAQKAAIREWVALGGHLLIACDTEEDADKRLIDAGGKKDVNKGAAALGLGTISFVAKNAATTEAEMKTQHLFGYDTSTLVKILDQAYNDGFRLRDLVGKLSRASGLIFIFILIFGIIIGPLNLFVLAPAGSRHKLFWTTPLIALVGTGLLLAAMFLQDGSGGSGARLSLGIMLPSEKKLVLCQEQTSKTGVLFGGDFEISEPVLMHQVVRDSDSFRSSTVDNVFVQNGSTYTGDWFESRNVQGQVLSTVRASRGAIQVKEGTNGQPPSVLSSFEVPLARVFIVDDQGKAWLATDLSPGVRKVMQSTPVGAAVDFKRWPSDSVPALASSRITYALTAMINRKQKLAIAEVADPAASKLAIPTLSSVRWTTDKAMLVGDYVIEKPE